MDSLFSAQEQKPREEERKVCQVVVRDPKGENMTINLCDTEEQMKSMTVLQLKKKIVERLSDDYDEEKLRLVFTNKALEDDSKLLSDYGIEHMSVIHMVLRLAGGGSVEKVDGGMGDKEDKNRSMENICSL